MRSAVAAFLTLGVSALLAAPALASSTPVELTAPTITGTAEVGQTLTTTLGTWSPQPDALTVQWEECDSTGNNCGLIPGATALTYVVTAANAGNTLVVRVTWTLDGASASAFSAITPVVLTVQQALEPNNVTPPQVDDAGGYTVIPGVWTGNPTSVSYQWLDCSLGSASYIDPGPLPPYWIDPPCTPIPDATGLSYAPTSSDIGFNLAVEEWATNAYGTGGPARSPLTYPYLGPPAVIAPPAPSSPPALTGAPSVAGSAIAGATLTATTGSWSGTIPITYGYQWQRCATSGCEPIAGATGATYVATSVDVGATIEVLVTAANAAGGISATSAAVGPVTALAAPAGRSATETLDGARLATIKRSLTDAIVPRSSISAGHILSRGGYTTAVTALTPGRLLVSWTVTAPGASRRTVRIATADVMVPPSGELHLRLVVPRAARPFLRAGGPLLRSGRPLDVRARATLTVAGGAALEVSGSFMLRG